MICPLQLATLRSTKCQTFLELFHSYSSTGGDKKCPWKLKTKASPHFPTLNAFMYQLKQAPHRKLLYYPCPQAGFPLKPLVVLSDFIVGGNYLQHRLLENSSKIPPRWPPEQKGKVSRSPFSSFKRKNQVSNYHSKKQSQWNLRHFQVHFEDATASFEIYETVVRATRIKTCKAKAF